MVDDVSEITPDGNISVLRDVITDSHNEFYSFGVVRAPGDFLPDGHKSGKKRRPYPRYHILKV
jgi:hypothetical protein